MDENSRRERVKESNRKWRTANIESARESNRRWRVANKKRIREYKRKYRAANKDSAHEQDHRYYVANREKVLEKGRNWYLQNREKAIMAVRRWRAENPEWHNAMNHNRRARIVGNGGSFTATEWKLLCEKYNHECLRCGERLPLTVDHVIPTVLNGTNNIDNIQPLCSSCNSRKHTRIKDYRVGWRSQCSQANQS